VRERTYRCPNCGAVKIIDQKEADESRVLQGEIPAFIWCMACPDKKHHYERVRVWGDDVTDRVVAKYNIIGTTATNLRLPNRKARRRLKQAIKRRQDETSA
jgi:hypothetical protein